MSKGSAILGSDVELGLLIVSQAYRVHPAKTHSPRMATVAVAEAITFSPGWTTIRSTQHCIDVGHAQDIPSHTKNSWHVLPQRPKEAAGASARHILVRHGMVLF